MLAVQRQIAFSIAVALVLIRKKDFLLYAPVAAWDS